MLLIFVTAASVLSGLASSHRLRLHEESGGQSNSAMLYFLWVRQKVSRIAAVFTLAGAVVVIVLGRAPGEASNLIRFLVLYVRYLSYFPILSDSLQACVLVQTVEIFCFLVLVTERYINRVLENNMFAELASIRTDASSMRRR